MASTLNPKRNPTPHSTQSAFFPKPQTLLQPQKTCFLEGLYQEIIRIPKRVVFLKVHKSPKPCLVFFAALAHPTAGSVKP